MIPHFDERLCFPLHTFCDHVWPKENQRKEHVAHPAVFFTQINTRLLALVTNHDSIEANPEKLEAAAEV
jgi:hypothetical protein